MQLTEISEGYGKRVVKSSKILRGLRHDRDHIN